MMFIENIKEALTSIFSNKMRSVLTMLGIIIGISSVITITTIGSSIRSTLNNTMKSLGGNSLYCYVSPIYPEDEEGWETWEQPEMDEDDYVTQEELDALIEKYPDEIDSVQYAAQGLTGEAKKDSSHYANLTIAGVSPGYIEYNKLDILRGRDVTAADSAKGKHVCVISDRASKYYFGEDVDPIGEKVTVTMSDGGDQEFVVVGEYEYKTTMGEDTSKKEQDRTTPLYIPYQTYMKMTGSEITGITDFQIMINAQVEDNSTVEDEVNEYFQELYADNQDYEVETENIASELGMIDTVLNVVTVAISLIAAISLIVGGVGVMNIMLVSITERTREIGVRMALGAKKRTIRSQFLIEAIVLCVIGGIIGILLGIFNGVLLGKVAESIIQSNYSEYADYIVMSVHPSATAILLSLLFSMLIGMFFGYYPAKKASQMEVIDALRYE